MERAKKDSSALSYSFPRRALSGERFRTHLPKAQTIASVLAAQIRSQGFACDDPAEGHARCEAVKAGLRCLGTNVQECHLQNWPISRYGGKGGKTEIGDRAPSLRLHRTLPYRPDPAKPERGRAGVINLFAAYFQFVAVARHVVLLIGLEAEEFHIDARRDREIYIDRLFPSHCALNALRTLLWK